MQFHRGTETLVHCKVIIRLLDDERVSDFVNRKTAGAVFLVFRPLFVSSALHRPLDDRGNRDSRFLRVPDVVQLRFEVAGALGHSHEVGEERRVVLDLHLHRHACEVEDGRERAVERVRRVSPDAERSDRVAVALTQRVQVVEPGSKAQT